MGRMGSQPDVIREECKTLLGGRDWLLFVTPVGRVVVAAASDEGERAGLLVARREFGGALDLV